MPIEFNHTLVWCEDQEKSARFLADMLGLPPPVKLYHFDVVDLANGVTIDFSNVPFSPAPPIQPQHYAFLVSESEFDEIFGRIKERELDYWADPRRQVPGEINHNDGGRGVYFSDPSGHYYEVITRPYAR
jgi:catechol 2,3-dioxygenase-like lactoylglutathione lyase family enzyme